MRSNSARNRLITFVALAALVGAACSGSDGESSGPVEVEDANETSGDGGDETSSEESGDEAAASTNLVDDLPQFTSDFDRICTTQVGFGGATPLADGPGPHPVILMQETDSGLLIESSADLPAGWGVEQDDDFDDNSEFVPLELVACSQITDRVPNGVTCELEGDDGEIIALDIVDVTYELTVYEATTGAVVGTETIEAADTDCPFFVFVDEGQTDYFNTPDEDQYINALKPYVAP